ILGAPLAIWPGAPGRLLDAVGRWFGPSGPEGAVKLREIQAAWIGGGKYAIQAEATNEGAAPLEWVRVEVRARAEGLAAAAVQSAYCGKVLDLGQIASMDPAEIRAFHGEPGPNSGAPAKASVTCQVVLTGLPAAPERFDLVVAKAELVARTPEAGVGAADQEEGLASEEDVEEEVDAAAPEAP
ncbi:MAG: hypothetical protein K8I02_10060, partial [Candidatus Methylomirabilis sp.]|nr:hypothetical protein [Deltaproteobacteria bacterium]